MSVFNAEKYLEETISSILNQTFKNFEFIIVNDGSTDKSLGIINSFNDDRIILINQSNQGLSKALNNGIKVSKSNYIARIDSDDVAHKKRFEIQLDFLLKNPDYIVVGSFAKNIDHEGNYLFSQRMNIEDSDLKNIFPYNPFIHPAIIFSKDAFYKAGQYCETMGGYAEDMILYNRMSKFGKFYNIPKYLINYRLLPSSLTLRGKTLDAKFIKILNKAILNNFVNDSDINYLKKLKSEVTENVNISNFYLMIAKNLLWNKYNPKLSRLYISKGFKNRLILHKFFLLYILSLFPKNLIKMIYKVLNFLFR